MTIYVANGIDSDYSSALRAFMLTWLYFEQMLAVAISCCLAYILARYGKPQRRNINQILEEGRAPLVSELQ